MFNYEKQRYECDRCGCWISSNKHIQLCDECENMLIIMRNRKGVST